MSDVNDGDRAKTVRFSASLPETQNDALETMAREKGLSKNDLLRHAVAFLTTADEAKKQGLDLALTKDNELFARLVPMW